MSVKQRHQKLKSRLKVAEAIARTVNSDGYKKYIQPLIDRMITDIDVQITAQKRDGIWQQGPSAQPGNIKDNDYYPRLFYYKQALIDLNNRIQSQVKGVSKIKGTLVELEEQVEAGTDKKTPYKYWG